jgi:hypothetical protein
MEEIAQCLMYKEKKNMKIRKGFVSNSSSSSFVIAIAEITDVEKFKELINDIDIGVYHCEIVSYEDFEMSSWHGRKKSNNAELSNDEKIISVNSFNDLSVSMSYDPTKKYLAYDRCMDSESDEDGETIYDDSVEDEIDAIAKAASGILVGLHISTGCGYNG